MRLSNRIAQGGRRRRRPYRINGFNYFSFWEGNYSGTWEGGSQHTLERHAEIGSNCISITTTWFVSTASSSDIHATANTEPDSGVEIAVAQAHATGMRTIIKPHLNSLDGTWSGDIVPANPTEWFSAYKAFILRFAQIAQDNDSYALSIGNELQDITGDSYAAYWSDIISSVRQIYTGKVIYASDWFETKTVSFWGSLDIIGVNFYIPIVTVMNPSLEQLLAGWRSVVTEPVWAGLATNNQPPLTYYKSLSEQHGKPLLFTEIGYRNDDQAAKDPGIWASDQPRNDALQARCYEAYFLSTKDLGSWFLGAQFWNWTVGTATGTGGQLENKDFTPQNRSAETVVETWFKNSPAEP